MSNQPVDEEAVSQTTRVGLSFKMAADIDAILEERICETSLGTKLLTRLISSGATHQALIAAPVANPTINTLGTQLMSDYQFKDELKRVIREELGYILKENIDRMCSRYP